MACEYFPLTMTGSCNLPIISNTGSGPLFPKRTEVGTWVSIRGLRMFRWQSASADFQVSGHDPGSGEYGCSQCGHCCRVRGEVLGGPMLMGSDVGILCLQHNGAIHFSTQHGMTTWQAFTSCPRKESAGQHPFPTSTTTPMMTVSCIKHTFALRY